MNRISPLSFLGIIIFFSACLETKTEKYQIERISEAGYTYETVTNDRLKMRLYTLKNGLKVYLSVNKDEPRLQTCIAVKAGSTYDPAETTGLAHYLEHMLFKGTDKIGTLDWEKEAELLNLISGLYEKHRMTDNIKEKIKIYQKIDSVSTLASKYAIANEFDKMVSSIGAKGTNAFTSNEQTVYINDIPSNELERWLKLESERFSQLVLRLFHTELESVYEEFNRGQDNDYWKSYDAMMRNLFPNHPYGTQSIIGTSEHLKNPSMVKIHEYFNNYYVPNNMAICLSGDIDPNKTILLIDQYFGKMVPKEVPQYIPIIPDPIKGKISEEVYGPDKERVMLGFRFDGMNSQDDKMVNIIDMVLSNSHAGIIDLELEQQQKILSAGCYPHFLKEYGIHVFYANAREGQTLEEAEDLLLGAIDKVKKGAFEDWMLEAVVNDMELSKIKQSESNGVAYDYVDAFIHDVPWIDEANKLDELRSITKEEIVQFANDHYNNDYVVIYKRLGEDTTVANVEKPPITPLVLNREDKSGFTQAFDAMHTNHLDPIYLNFKEAIQTSSLGSGIDIHYIENTTNDLFYLYYILDMGKRHDKELSLAVNYLPYLGTSKYSPAELQKEFYKLGLTIDVMTGASRSYVYVSGLGKSFEKGVELLEHVMTDIQPSADAYSDYVEGILKKRSDNKLN
ncbi:MAG TPA: insulinase family protein, partial [Flavobacteriales bacterium]|nr:insulinase family protein [Flavobacteriales bacterium]